MLGAYASKASATPSSSFDVKGSLWSVTPFRRSVTAVSTSGSRVTWRLTTVLSAQVTVSEQLLEPPA